MTGPVVVVGGSGLIGRAVVAAFGVRGVEARAVAAPRLRLPDDGSARARALAEGPPADDGLVAALRGAAAVVNAAGIADPDARDAAALLGANAALPAAIVRSAARAGVGRLVHISSAAVQGRRDPLDETATTEAFSPYSTSKAAGERLLETARGPVAVCIYRPTSVLAPGRGVTRSLVRLARLPVVPIVGRGDRPLPVAHLDNVAAAVVHLALGRALGIALHPWEGFDLRGLLTAFGARRFVELPAAVGAAAIAAGRRLGREGAARRLELLIHGQRQTATALAASGFAPPAGPDAYAALADATVGSRGVDGQGRAAAGPSQRGDDR